MLGLLLLIILFVAPHKIISYLEIQDAHCAKQRALRLHAIL